MTGLLFALALASAPQKPTPEEICQAYTVMREAGGASKRAQRNVLQVLRNRMSAKGKKCRAIVAEKHQWSWWRRNIRMKVSKKQLRSFRKVSRMRPTLPACTMFFHDVSVKPSWARGKKVVAREGKLRFYC